MFIAIATDDFNVFANNNEVDSYALFTNDTEHPIFTGMTVEDTRSYIENYYRLQFNECETLPEYEVCEIVTAAIVKGAYKLNVSCDCLNG